MPLTRPRADQATEQNPRSRLTAEAAMVALTDADPVQRQAAARSLWGVEAAASSLCERFSVEDDLPTREALAVALMRTGGQVVVDRLLPLLSSEDAALRNQVIEILQTLPADVAPHMEKLLDDPDPDVRIFVVNILEALRHPKVEDWLIAVITTDQHVNVVGTALDLLGEVGTGAALSSLHRVRDRFAGEPYVEFAATNAIKRIGTGS